jgi:hypothetical protein
VSFHRGFRSVAAPTTSSVAQRVSPGNLRRNSETVGIRTSSSAPPYTVNSERTLNPALKPLNLRFTPIISARRACASASAFEWQCRKMVSLIKERRGISRSRCTLVVRVHFDSSDRRGSLCRRGSRSDT